MKIYFYMAISFFVISCNQKSKVFEIETENVNKNVVQELKSINFQPNGIFYDDEKYEIWSSCSGEWEAPYILKIRRQEKCLQQNLHVQFP